MLEASLFFVIFLAGAYWTVLWLMGRREDVLHGQFVEGDLQPGEPGQSVLPKSILPEPALPEAVRPERPAFRPDLLQSLLTSIKRDIEQLTRK